MQAKQTLLGFFAMAAFGAGLVMTFGTRANAQISSPMPPHFAYPKMQYKVSPVADKATDATLTEQLNLLGQQGWEYLQMTTLKGGKQVIILSRAGQ